jgi:hypothetical protein
MSPWPIFFSSKGVSINAMHLLSNAVIRPNLELKTRHKQLLGYLPLDIALPGKQHKPISIHQILASGTSLG